MSVSVLQKLIIRAYDLFLGKWAEQGEPLVSTFSREMVDNNNNTVMTSAQATALVAAMGSGESGTVSLGSFPIPAGVDYVQVTGLDLEAAPTKVVCTVMKVTGGGNFWATPRLDSFTTDGFIVDLQGITDTDDYVLTFIHN